MHLGWGKEGRDRVSFLGMQEGKPGIFQTLEIQYACSQAFEKDEENRSFSPQPLPRTPGREANRERQLGERLSGDKEIKWIQIKEHQKEKGPDFMVQMSRNSDSGEPGVRGRHCLT